MGWNQFLIRAGILLFFAVVLFQLVTLPVEFNASSRALKILSSTGLLQGDENEGARKVLSAAALTYVAGAAASILQLLRLIILFGGRGRRETLYLSSEKAEMIRGKRVLIVDDVISTGESLNALEKLVKAANGEISGKAAVLAEGGAADRTDIIFLEKLPLFFK